MVIEQTLKNLKLLKKPSPKAVRSFSSPLVAAPQRDWEDFQRLKSFLFENVYKRPQVCIMNEKGRLILSRLFSHLEKNPEMLPRSLKPRFELAGNRRNKRRIIADYISGMTDRYAMDLYQMMFEPYEKIMFGFRE
jgi:dGTPase